MGLSVFKLFGEEQFPLINLSFESESFGFCRFHIYLSLRSRRREDRKEVKKGEGLGREGRGRLL